MKSIFYTLLIVLLFSACNTKDQKANDSEALSNEALYFGLEPPGMTPQSFAADSDWELGGMHGEDLEEFYFTSGNKLPLSPLVVSFRKEDRVWKNYQFHASGSDTLYSRDKYIERTKSGWSKIKSIGAPFDTLPIMRLTASRTGTLVFDEWTSDGSGVIWFSRLKDGKWEAPKPFGPAINSGSWLAHPFIAYDESYIIWDSEMEGGHGDGDMYISFKLEDGSWGDAINFGDKINTDGEDGGGYVTPDGKYLSYCPRCNPPYDRMWVDAQIIEELRTR